MKTKVSVLICVRNVEEYISKRIRSILEQTFQDFKLAIIDDLSGDNTRCAFVYYSLSGDFKKTRFSAHVDQC